jgi:CheY-like chemotaxis protein
MGLKFVVSRWMTAKMANLWREMPGEGIAVIYDRRIADRRRQQREGSPDRRGADRRTGQELEQMRTFGWALIAAAEPQDGPIATPGRSPAAVPTILVIDDDAAACRVLEEFVIRLGYTAATAKTAVTGLAAVQRMPGPDAVLLDLAISGELNSLDVLRWIKRVRPDVPVVMVTADADPKVSQVAWQAAAFDHVTKPVGLTRLGEILAAAMEMSGKAPPA